MANAFVTALPSLISAVTLAALGLVGRHVRCIVADFETLRKAQRDQLRACIVSTYGMVDKRGYVSTYELSCVNEMYESYKALGGNSFVRTLVRHMNEDYEIRKK